VDNGYSEHMESNDRAFGKLQDLEEGMQVNFVMMPHI
jgi:hypothetical protein